MPSVGTNEQIVREDLSDAYLNFDVRKTPLQKMMGRGENLHNVKLYSWPLEKYDGRQVLGIPEDKDADTFESDKQFQLYNRSQKFWRTPHVTTEANEINVAPANFGKMDRQKAKKTEEQQRDIETRLCDDGISRDDDGTRGREFYGLGRVINDGTSVGSSGAALTFSDPQTVIDVNFRTPTAQIYTGFLTDLETSDGTVVPIFNEDALIAMLKSRYDNFGQTTQLKCICDSLLKVHFSKYFGKYQANVKGYTAIVRTPTEAIMAKDFAGYGADLLQTDFGPIDINLSNFLPTRSDGTLAGRAYFLDMEMLKLRPSGLWMTTQDLEDKGAGPRALIQSILGWEYGHPGGHCKVDPETIQSTNGS